MHKALCTLALCGTAVLSGCSSFWPPISNGSIGDVSGKALVADYRLATVQQNPKDIIQNRRNPIVCAEPSPDVARAFSSALSLSLSKASDQALSAGDSKSRDLNAALQYQTSQAVAQLGKRYATVQILRDILHSQCVQYANGTMSEATWASLQSQFNSLVVTLLAVEMAGEAAPMPITLTSDTGGSGSDKSPDQLFVAAGVAVESSKTAASDFSTKVGKVKAAADAASAPKEVKAASTSLTTVQGNLAKTVDVLQKAWAAVAGNFGKPATDATKSSVDAFKKAIPAKDDKDIAAAATAVAAAASAAASAPGTSDAKSANEDIAKVAGSFQASAEALDAVLAGKALKGTATAEGSKDGKSADASVEKVAAIAAIQKAYLERDPLGPSLLACLTYLDPPGAPASDRKESLEIRTYCQGVFNSRVEQASYYNQLLLSKSLTVEDLARLGVGNPNRLLKMPGANLDFPNLLQDPPKTK